MSTLTKKDGTKANRDETAEHAHMRHLCNRLSHPRHGLKRGSRPAHGVLKNSPKK